MAVLSCNKTRQWLSHTALAIGVVLLSILIFMAWRIERAQRNALPLSVWRDIVAMSPAAVLVIDGDTRIITEWSPSATKFFGWTSEEVLGKDVLELCEDNERANVKVALESQIFQQRLMPAPLELTGKIVSKESGVVKVRGTLTGIPTTPPRIVAVFTPVSLLAEATKTLEQQAQDLKVVR